jgi:hypothetical protein
MPSGVVHRIRCDPLAISAGEKGIYVSVMVFVRQTLNRHQQSLLRRQSHRESRKTGFVR